MNDFLRGVALAVVVSLLVGPIVAICVLAEREKTEAPIINYGPKTGPPPEAPTLDYEKMVGLDPQTVQTNRERERHNQLEDRMEALEATVYALQQAIRGRSRIGDAGPTESSEGDFP